jgi:hypothetical protein
MKYLISMKQIGVVSRIGDTGYYFTLDPGDLPAYKCKRPRTTWESFKKRYPFKIGAGGWFRTNDKSKVLW